MSFFMKKINSDGVVEIVMSELNYAYCAVDVTSKNVKPDGEEIYEIGGRVFDCASMPYDDWLSDYNCDNGFKKIDASEVDAAFLEALGRTVAYVS